MRAVSMVALLMSVGCSADPLCPKPAAILSTVDGMTLTCANLVPVREHIALLAGRRLERQPLERLNVAYKNAFTVDALATTQRIRDHDESWQSLRHARGAQAVQKRSEQVLVRLKKGSDALTELEATLLAERVAIWSRDDAQNLLFTESDIEGWIRYLSLLREVQGGFPLVLSVADRARVYQLIIERFDNGTPGDRVAMSQIGALWYALADAWQSASFEQQQAWIANAPLPPPMTASSLGYVETALDSDVVVHAQVMFAHFGALRIKRQDAR